MQSIWQLRRALHALEPEDAAELLISGIRKTKNNAEFLAKAVDTFRK